MPLKISDRTRNPLSTEDAGLKDEDLASPKKRETETAS
jgi:hypothetical protein